MPRPRRDGSPARPANRKLLTDAFVRNAIPEDRVYVVWDTKVKGLALAVHQTRRTWKCVYRRNGRPEWLHLGNANSIPLREARRLAARALVEVAAGGDPVGDRRRAREADTFADLHSDYVQLCARRRNRSWHQTAELMRRHVLPRLGKKRAADVTRGDVKLVLAKLADQPAFHNKTLASISAVFSWALREEVGGVTSNPCALIRRLAVRSRERVLADSEIALLWPHLDTTLRLQLLTGARIGEVANMRAMDVVDGVWNLPGAPIEGWPGVKNGRNHRVPLSELAAVIAAEHLAHRPKRRSSEGLLIRIWTRLGVPKITSHDLRRTFATLIARFGFGRQALDRLLNHADRGVATVYDRFEYLEQDKAIVATITRHIVRLVEGVEAGNVVRLR